MGIAARRTVRSDTDRQLAFPGHRPDYVVTLYRREGHRMPVLRRAIFALVAALAAAPAAFAQAPGPTRVRGTIDTVGAHDLTLTMKSGEKVTLKLADDAGFTWIEPIAVDAIKPGSFIGTAAVTQPDGTLKALEIQVFPEAMRGVGEGHRDWDLGAGSSMTNGTVGDLKVADGRTLKLAYKGGEQTVYVPPNAPVITYSPATKAALTPGSHVIIFAMRNPDESLTATRISVGKDGLVPPM
jgi:hypothetical protein